MPALCKDALPFHELGFDRTSFDQECWLIDGQDIQGEWGVDLDTETDKTILLNKGLTPHEVGLCYWQPIITLLWS